MTATRCSIRCRPSRETGCCRTESVIDGVGRVKRPVEGTSGVVRKALLTLVTTPFCHEAGANSRWRRRPSRSPTPPTGNYPGSRASGWCSRPRPRQAARCNTRTWTAAVVTEVAGGKQKCHRVRRRGGEGAGKGDQADGVWFSESKSCCSWSSPPKGGARPRAGRGERLIGRQEIGVRGVIIGSAADAVVSRSTMLAPGASAWTHSTSCVISGALPESAEG